MQKQEINPAWIKRLKDLDDGSWDTLIQPSSAWAPLKLGELWAYRELLYFFVLRNIKLRYKQTMMGGLWVILQPVMPMLIFTIFFGILVRVPSDNVPYPVFTFIALLPWQLFAYSFHTSSQSLVANQGLIKKVYFPRLLFPLSATLDGLIDFLIAFAVLLAMLYYYQIFLTWTVLALPLLLLLTVLTSLSMGLWFSALNALYRDVSHIAAFFSQFMMFATPIFYPASLVPEKWRLFYGLNPMVGVVEGFRWALLRHTPPPVDLLGIALLVVAVIFVSGLYYFRRMEDTFADVV